MQPRPNGREGSRSGAGGCQLRRVISGIWADSPRRPDGSQSSATSQCPRVVHPRKTGASRSAPPSPSIVPRCAAISRPLSAGRMRSWKSSPCSDRCPVVRLDALAPRSTGPATHALHPRRQRHTRQAVESMDSDLAASPAVQRSPAYPSDALQFPHCLARAPAQVAGGQRGAPESALRQPTQSLVAHAARVACDSPLRSGIPVSMRGPAPGPPPPRPPVPAASPGQPPTCDRQPQGPRTSGSA